MTRIAYLAIASIVAFAAVPGNARDNAEKRLSTAVERELAAQGPIVTDADHALIARKCGDAPGARHDNIRIDDDTLHCANGRRVAMDGELRAMNKRISERAHRHVARALKSTEVALATSEVAREATERAMKEVHWSLKQTQP